MQLRSYLKEHNIRVTHIQKATKIPYSTISDIVNGKTSIDNVSVRVFMQLAEYLQLSMEELYELAKNTTPTPILESPFTLTIKNGKYYIKYNKQTDYLCENTDINARYIGDIAKTHINNIKRKEMVTTWKTRI